MRKLRKTRRNQLGVTVNEFQAVLDNAYLDCSGLFDGKKEVEACEAAAQDVWMRSLSFLKDKKRPDFSRITTKSAEKCSKYPEFSEEVEACKAGLNIVHKRLKKIDFELGKKRRQ